MTNESTSLVNLGDLTKPATILVEKICNAVGIIYEPTYIAKVAKAQATARIIETESNLKIAELQRRALQRFIAEETRKQSNIESIITKALEGLKENAHPQDIEDDWIVNFFDKCKLVSDKKMQQLWAKILAREANQPGSYSKRTIIFLSSMDKSDAELFTKLCDLKVIYNEEFLFFIYNHQDEIYRRNNINFSSLKHLDDIGLITFHNFNVCLSTSEDTIKISYSNKLGKINLIKKPSLSFDLGEVTLTAVGQELAKVCPFKPSLEFYDYIIQKWIEKKYIVYSDYPI